MRLRREKCCSRLLEDFAVEQFQVILSKVLGACEESIFRFGEASGVFEPLSDQFKRTDYVRDLKESVSGRLDCRNEFCARSEEGERLFQQRCQLPLAVVVVNLQLLEGIEIGRMVKEKLGNLLKQRIVEPLFVAYEVLVNLEALVGYVCLVHEQEHSAENASSSFAAQCRIFVFTTNQRSRMDAMRCWKIQRGQRMLKLGDFVGDADGLIMENHADQVIPRGIAIWIEASRFVHKDTDFACVVHFRLSKTKARIAPRLRQESFPRAGDSGFRLCRTYFTIIADSGAMGKFNNFRRGGLPRRIRR